MSGVTVKDRAISIADLTRVVKNDNLSSEVRNSRSWLVLWAGRHQWHRGIQEASSSFERSCLRDLGRQAFMVLSNGYCVRFAAPSDSLRWRRCCLPLAARLFSSWSPCVRTRCYVNGFLVLCRFPLERIPLVALLYLFSKELRLRNG